MYQESHHPGDGALGESHPGGGAGAAHLPPDGGDFLLVDESFARRLFERYRTGRGERREEQPKDQAPEQAEGGEQAESTDRRE